MRLRLNLFGLFMLLLGVGAITLAYTPPGSDRLQQSIQDYTVAIEANPSFVGAYNLRGLALMESGDLDGAIADFTTAIALDPTYADLYYHRGQAHHTQGSTDRAIRDFTTALVLNPAYAEAYQQRGYAYADTGDLEHAILDLTAYLHHAPAADDRDAVFHTLQQWTSELAALSTKP